MSRVALSVVWVLVVAAGGCDRGISAATARGSVATVPRVVINEIMANPRATVDERGEWIELLNLEATPVELRGWTIASEHDRGVVIDRSVVIPPDGFALLARDGDERGNGGLTASFVYGSDIALGNGADWVALRLADGRTIDSVSWTSAIAGASRALTAAGSRLPNVSGPGWVTSTSRFGHGDLGTPLAANDGATVVRGSTPGRDQPTTAPSPGPPAAAAPATGERATAPTGTTGSLRLGGDPPRDSTLTVRFLDVGQGDAILIENGGSRVLVDGGPDNARFGRLLEQLGIEGSTVDAVILTHEHYDHYSGLRELFRTRRRIGVRYFFENRDPNANTSLADLRDSIGARVRRGQLQYRDTDDPCGTGAPSCTIAMRGGARVHVLRPDPRGDGANNRSAAVKVVAPDSTAFMMWLAGDAERPAIRWFDATDYDRSPGMRASVLKADHHGSCDGISPRYLDLVRPDLVAISLASVNDYGYVHSQTLDLLASRRIPWYRTDQNGTITITVPPRRPRGASARGYLVSVERGGASMKGPSDRRARNCGDQ